MEFREIEVKYRADDISVEDFSRVCTLLQGTFGPCTEASPSSYDHYYALRGPDGPRAFIRHRCGASPELTTKRRDSKTNNFVRTEANVRLSPDQEAAVKTFCENIDFVFNFSIYKTCMIYWFDKFNLVHYRVWQDEKRDKILGSFIEIEMKEGTTWPDEAAAWSELMRIERSLEALGLCYQRRVRKSLFEMFSK